MVSTFHPGRQRPCDFRYLWLGPLLGLLCSIGVPGAAHADDILFIYGGYADDNAYKRTLQKAKQSYNTDRIVATITAGDLESRYADLIIIEGDAEVLDRCGGGRPPDLKLLEEDMAELKRDMDLEGQIYAYDIAIQELVCAGDRLPRDEAADLYIKRGMVHYKNGDTDMAQEDFESAFILDPSHEWNDRHSPKARKDFDAAKSAAYDGYSHSIYAAEDGPNGSGIRIDGLTIRPGDPVKLLPGQHLISWWGRDGGDDGILNMWGTATMIGPMGLFDFLFREPLDRTEEWLLEQVLDEIAYIEDVDQVVLLEPVIPEGSLARAGRYGSPARAGIGTGYARLSSFDYGSAYLDLWLRISGIVHAELKVEFDITSGRATGASATEEALDDDVDPATLEISDYYYLPSVQIGIGFRESHGPVQPGGGIAARVYFTGPSLIVMPAIVGYGGVDIRAWQAPIVARIGILAGANLASGGNDSLGRSLEESADRFIFGANIGVGFIL